jgi:hypothetical protein
MSELKADLIQLARIPWVTFPESATRSDRPVVLVLAGVLVDARVDASVGLDYRAGIAMDPRVRSAGSRTRSKPREPSPPASSRRSSSWKDSAVVRSAGVLAELRDESGVGDSIDLVLQVFAHLESGEEIVAHVGDERPWLMLGLRGVLPDERARFIRLALLEAYLDPVSGDPLAWQALISALEAEGLSYSVEELRPRPFAVEFGPRLTEALG